MISPYKAVQLVKALLEDYPDNRLTGYLMDVHITSYCAMGRVYKHAQYPDGRQILTEEIHRVVAFEGRRPRYLIETVDGEQLLVVSFHSSGGRKSMELLLDMFSSGALSGSRYCVQ